MEVLEQHKKEVRKRLRIVFNSYGKSSRAFSETIGLKPTSFHKVLTGPAGLTIPLANSIELKHGYRAEWLLTGKGDMKIGKHVKKTVNKFYFRVKKLENIFQDNSFENFEKYMINLNIIDISKSNTEKVRYLFKNCKELIVRSEKNEINKSILNKLFI